MFVAAADQRLSYLPQLLLRRESAVKRGISLSCHQCMELLQLPRQNLTLLQFSLEKGKEKSPTIIHCIWRQLP